MKIQKISYSKLILIFIIAGITIFSLLWYITALQYGKILYYFDEYKLNKVKIDTVYVKKIHLPSSFIYFYEVHYNHKKIDIQFPKKTFFKSKETEKNYNHLSKIIRYKDWMDERALQGKFKKGTIWIYENPHAKDFYAKGKLDKLKYNTYIFKFIINIILLLISIYGFYIFLRFMINKE